MVGARGEGNCLASLVYGLLPFYTSSTMTYSRTSLIRTRKGQSEGSVLERCPYKRGHYDDVNFMTPLTVLSVQ